MDRDKLERFKAHVRNPNFIAGIHNYCDRWCERCPMTARCSIYEPARDREAGADDPDNEAFWEQIKETFEMTAALLEEMADEAGVDLEALAAEADDDRPEVGEDHILVMTAARYDRAVRDWFERYRQIGEMMAEAPPPAPALREVGVGPSDAQVKDWLEVIQWYQPLIRAKLYRAVQHDPTDDIEERHDFPRDADGSAKVALIGMDRSAAAWTGLIDAVPEARDEILGFIAQLDGLRRATEFAFPDARAFVRPGFDEG